MLPSPHREKMSQCLFQMQPEYHGKRKLSHGEAKDHDNQGTSGRDIKAQKRNNPTPLVLCLQNVCLSHEHLQLHLTIYDRMLFILPFFRWNKCLLSYLCLCSTVKHKNLKRQFIVLQTKGEVTSGPNLEASNHYYLDKLDLM